MDLDDSNPETGRTLDAELIGRARAGERAALRRMVDDHLPSITRFAFRMLGDRAEAEDVAQETFLRLWRELDRWEPRARLSTWLHRVAHNLCVDRLRARRQVRLTDDAEVADPQEGVAARLESLERTEALSGALGALPERQRAAVTLVYHQGLSNREAADVLGVEVDALESLLARGRQGLRKLLAAHIGADDRSR
jgi:RNA polymerase sigma-70 factor, ECF subfamily